jgi:hypothetical protein
MTEPEEPIHSPALMAVIYADRLQAYAHRITDRLWSGDRRLQIAAMADAAEANQISVRLYGYLQKMVNRKEE